MTFKVGDKVIYNKLTKFLTEHISSYGMVVSVTPSEKFSIEVEWAPQSFGFFYLPEELIKAMDPNDIIKEMLWPKIQF